jgi:glycosyltransferase involved in cell wall biosynthesis
MKLLISAMMGPGTLESKLEPLVQLEEVSHICFIRKNFGPKIKKVEYITIGKLSYLKVFHLIISPLKLISQTIKQKPALLISYHIIPYGFFVAFTGLITKTPYIISQTGLVIQKQAKHKLFRQFLYFIFKYSFQVNCPGTKSVEYWKSIFPNLQGKFKVLHSTIDTSYFKTDEDISKEYDFIFLGGLQSIKNIDIIIHGFANLIRANSFSTLPKMVIVGNGPEEKQLHALVGDLDLEEHVTFTGFTSKPVSYLQKSRFLVMDSDSEGLPTAMMQAMACEVVPVTSLVGNIADVVSSGKTGFVHQGKNLKSISETMKKALQTDNETLAKMKIECRNLIVNKHSHQFATSKWDEVFSRLSIIEST